MEESKMMITASGGSHRGEHRENNEDNYQIGTYFKEFLIDQDTYSCVPTEISSNRYYIVSVFDGMGGGENGELASMYAAEEIRSAYMKIQGKSVTPEIVKTMICDAFQSANNRIMRDSFEILGTTGVVGIFDLYKKTLKILWSGDSRAYLYRDGYLFQLTQDQSIGAISLENGFYTQANPQYQIDKNKLTGYIGNDGYGYTFSPLESNWIPLNDKDAILLATDGLYGSFTEEELNELIRGSSINDAVLCLRNILNAAVSRNIGDDMTLVYASVTGKKV